ncbi:MAG: ATP-dependent RecD-like DNA helicase [Firmicutes bacterium]|nr:ATP-dependent RecD-like DNA helicase [Bacillota bacterium]
MEELRGCIEEIVFHNEENGYTVALVSTEQEELFTVVGNLPFAKEGSSFSFFGKTVIHPNYGLQFSFEEYKEIIPTTKEGIEVFLASGIVKGIGPKTAAAIVGRFGEDTLEIMENDPERLLEVDGIGSKKLEQISDSFKEHKEISSIVMFLQGHDVAAGYAAKIYKKYGANAIRIIEENPYRLADEIWGIGFRTADAIAEKLGIRKDSEYRIESGIKHILSREAGEGHTYLPKKELIEKAVYTMGVDSSLVEDILDTMPFKGDIRIENIESRACVFLMAYFYAETNVCSNLIRLLREEHKQIFSDVDGLIRAAEEKMDLTLEEEQLRAVKSAAENGVCVITGGPGTGKTTIINTIINIFDESGFDTAVAAPTGRAAKRITETSGYEAKTIHRLLEYVYSPENGEGMGFSRNENSPLDADVVIIDEASMIDILLMNALLNAMKPGSRLVLVGDADQLPPVGAGNVLRDIIDSELVHTVKLNRIFRQAEESLIVVNAHRINKGEYPYYNEKDKDYFLLRRNTASGILETIKELCKSRLPSFYKDCDAVRDVQVITPVKKGMTGTVNLNKELQDVLNPPAPGINEKVFKNRVFREGDKVMQIKNNYDIQWKNLEDFSEGRGIFNGDIGYIKSIDKEYNEITVIFEDVKAALYDATRFDELELAYAVTVHKSQGSEYPVVVMPMTWIPPVMATRNLLYTAVTRARLAVIIVGNPDIMNEMVDNNRITERYSGLKARLRVFLDYEI